MSAAFKIPLSYHAPDTTGLARILNRHEGQHHQKIINDFEHELSQLTGSRYVVAVNSGTAAIHLGLLALGVKPGDEVLVSTFTYVASVNPILYLGARPVFIDSEARGWNMDPNLLELALKHRKERGRLPAAIVPVYSYGMPPRMDDVLSLAEEFGVPVLEDSAEAIGSTYKGKHAGTLGRVGILSFNNNKLLTTYGGGALLTDDPDIHQKAIRWASQSREDKPYYFHTEPGFSYRMGPLNAAVGLAGCEGFESALKERQETKRMYERDLSEVQWPQEPVGAVSNWWLSTPMLGERKASNLVAQMEREGIECRNVWNPMHLQPLFRGYEAYLSGVSQRLFESSVCVPSGVLSKEDRAFICDFIRTYK